MGYFNKDLLINSALAAGLVLFGAFTSGHISAEAGVGAIAGAAIVFITRLKNYSDTQMKKNKKGEGYFNLANL